MSSIENLSFVGRRRGGRPRSFWQVRHLLAHKNDLSALGRELGEEFAVFMAEHPDRVDLIDKILLWMPRPMGPVEIAFLAQISCRE